MKNVIESKNIMNKLKENQPYNEVTTQIYNMLIDESNNNNNSTNFDNNDKDVLVNIKNEGKQMLNRLCKESQPSFKRINDIKRTIYDNAKIINEMEIKIAAMQKLEYTER